MNIVEERMCYREILDCERYNVSENKRKAALDVLNWRIKNGEDPFDITGINKKEGGYYLKKIMDGLCPINDMIYYRITKRIPYSLGILLRGALDQDDKTAYRKALEQKLAEDYHFLDKYFEERCNE